MKLYVKASKEISKSYDKVSEALQKLFGFDYSRYKKESDWFESDKFGTVKYKLNSAMNNPGFYRIAIFFGGDLALDNFYKFLRFCNENDVYVSMQYPKGDREYGVPQINIRVEKVYAYTPSDIKAICKFVESYINEVSGDTTAKCICGAFEGHWRAVAGANNVELRAEYFGYGDGRGRTMTMAEDWCNSHINEIAQINSTIKDGILANFSKVKQCKIEEWGLGFNIKLKF